MKIKTQDNEVLSVLVTTCTTYLPAHVSQNKIRNMLGFQTRSFYNYTKRVTHNISYHHINHKERKVSDLQKQKRDCVDKFFTQMRRLASIRIPVALLVLK